MTNVARITACEVARLIGEARLSLAREADAQVDLGLFLAAALPLGCALAREVRLSPQDRPDFVVDGRIAIEVKRANARGLDIARQLARYADHEQIEAIVQVGGPKLGPEATRAILKPVFHVSLGRAWL